MEALKLAEQESTPLSDDQIVRRVLAGEKGLFEILMRRYNQTVFRVIRTYLKDDDDVEDAMQNTYLNAFGKLHQFQGNSAYSTWLIRICINEALMRLKQIKRSKNVFLYPDTESRHSDMITNIIDKRMNPEKTIINQEAKQLLELAIDKLPEKYRIIYMLKEIDELDNREIQESLGITENNIKVRLHRAKALLKESLFELTSNGKVFEFGNKRCDSIVDYVMKRI